jgi:hypothetical protein
MKPNGFVAALSIISKISRFIRRQSCFSSLTSAIFTRDDLGIESRGCASAWGIYATHYFGNLREAELLVARIFSLRGESEIEIGRDAFGAFAVRDGAAQTAFFENRQHQLFGRAWIGGAFENDELIALQVGRDGPCGVLDVAEVRFAALVEGVGTQMRTASISRRRVKSDVASKCFASTWALIFSAGIC